MTTIQNAFFFRKRCILLSGKIYIFKNSKIWKVIKIIDDGIAQVFTEIFFFYTNSIKCKASGADTGKKNEPPQNIPVSRDIQCFPDFSQRFPDFSLTEFFEVAVV